MKLLTNKEYDRLIKEAYDDGYDEGFFIKVKNEIEESNASVVFDFYNPDITVFSIERVPVKNKGDIECTLISYYHNSDTKCYCKWYAHCSREKHEELAIQFAEYLDDRGAKNIKSKK
jgi:hypothetical protein